MNDGKQQQITCECGHAFVAKEGWRTETVREDVVEHVLVCPACEARTHLNFETTALRAEREKMRQALHVYQKGKTERLWRRFKAAQAVFQRKYDREQKHWRKKLGRVEKEGAR